MRLRSTLFQVAALASATFACSSSSNGGSDAGSTPDSGPDAPTICGGCNCGAPAITQGDATPEQACAIAAESFGGSACHTFCAGLNHATGQTYFCTLPGSYTTAFQSAQSDAGADAGRTCPAESDPIVVQCGYPCLGRRTSGIAEPTPCAGDAIGDVFAGRAYLEAVSVHAFARLERELAFHRAPVALRRNAGRARRDEIRHTAMAARLARRFGAEPRLPAAPSETPARSLFDIARENAVEGCVREMYGAVMGLVEAATSSDADVRLSSQRIAEDECRHAELAMDVMRWIRPLLGPSERTAVDEAVGEAIADLAERGHRPIVAMLDESVWRHFVE